MKLIYYPNVLLNTPTKHVIEFGETLKNTLEEMKTIMVKYNGLGISANQVGLSNSIFLFKDTKGDIHNIINPKIINSEETINISEGCLSFPGIYIPITRKETIEIEYQNSVGEVQKAMAYGMDARIILHEMDHLNGVDFLSHTNRATRKAAQAKLRKLK